MRFSAVSLSVLALAACATAPEKPLAEANAYSPTHEDRRLDRLVSDKLETFTSEREFRDYLKRVKIAATQRGGHYGWAGKGVQYAQLGPPAQPPCDPLKEDCEKKLYSDQIVVTGSMITSTPESAPVATEFAKDLSITNNQTAQVDEGDIVKLIGRYLVVLQDGRLFSIDLKPGGEDGMKLVDRHNVYSSAADDGWYDEMLVTGNRILVTSYSYDEDGTKLSVLRIGDDGRITDEGAFVISSNDYYSTENYATRMVGDKLVIYSPIYLPDVNPDEPMQWPLVRRWQKDKARAEKSGERLFNAREIYKPMQPTLAPVVHTVSICDIGTASMEKNLPCRSTAIVAPESTVFYVSPTDAYFWSATSDDLWAEWEGRCATKDVSFEDGIPAGLYRLPLSGAKPAMMRVKGAPQDQFAIDAANGEIRGLVIWNRTGCEDEDWETRKTDVQLKYFSASLSLFKDDIRTPSLAHYTSTPSPGEGYYENRFTGSHVVYGSRNEWSSYAPEGDETVPPARVVAVPLKHPDDASVLTAPHGVQRAERVGDNIVLTGYGDAKGLSLSFMDLSAEPRIASTEVLENRFESEGRSHAFNSRVDKGGGGMLGIPTVVRSGDSGRWWWRSNSSDVSFLTFDKAGRMKEAGALIGRETSEHADYKCEVSCVDWYGNSRPFFISGRIFALSGTELIEGRLAEGEMLEADRVNLTNPLD